MYKRFRGSANNLQQGFIREIHVGIWQYLFETGRQGIYVGTRRVKEDGGTECMHVKLFLVGVINDSVGPSAGCIHTIMRPFHSLRPSLCQPVHLAKPANQFNKEFAITQYWTCII